MSEIDVTWLEDGNWVRYDYHVAAVERVIAERNAARAEVNRLKALIVSQHNVMQWANEREAIEAIVQEAQEREQREAAANGGRDE